jgi:D-alanine transaminase
MQFAMVGDKIVKTAKLKLAYMDRGIYFGDGVYEVLRSYDGKIFALEEHLDRLSKSLGGIGIQNVDIDEIRRRVLKAFEAAGLDNAKIYFHITRGSAPRSHTWDSAIEPNFFLTIGPVPDDTKDKANGIAVCTQPDLRWKRCDIKSLNLLPNILARQAAAKKGCQEAILVDEAGLITEGAGSAFFAILAETVQTAPLTANILPSITRGFIFKAASNIGLDVLEESLTPQKAVSANELFIAVTTKDIVPVVKFDDKIIGDGKPGKYTKALIEAFRKFTS